MAFIVRRPWTEQPQEAVEVDWGNPLARGLLLAFLPSASPAGTPYNAARGGGTLALTAGAPTRRPGRAGIFFDGADKDNYWTFTPAATLTAGTIFALLRQTSAGQEHGPWRTNNTENDYTPFSDGNFYLNTFASTRYVNAVAAPIDLGGYTVAARGSGVASSHAAFVNGIKIGSTNSAFVCNSSIVLGANQTAFAGPTSRFALTLLWDRALSDAEVAEVNANPWQLFAPRRPLVPVSAAGGGPATFDASVSGTASTSAALTTAIRLAGSVNGSASVAAPLTTAIRFAASVNATASTSAALTTAIRAAASVSGTATATGALTTAIRFAGSVAGSATVSANLSAGGGVAASVSASATATAALTTSIRLAAAVSAQASATAALTTAIRLASAVSGSATTTAALTATSGGVAAAVTASASATASLTTAVRMAAIANASASASAALAGSIAVTTGSVVYIPIRALTGLWSTTIPAESDLANLRAWLPQQRVQLVDANGVMRAEWYRFFHFLAEKKLGGATSPTIPEIATSLTSAVDQSASASLATASLAQQVTSNADSLDVTVQVARNNNLIGAGSIPPVQRSTQQTQ